MHAAQLHVKQAEKAGESSPSDKPTMPEEIWKNSEAAETAREEARVAEGEQHAE